MRRWASQSILSSCSFFSGRNQQHLCLIKNPPGMEAILAQKKPLMVQFCRHKRNIWLGWSSTCRWFYLQSLWKSFIWKMIFLQEGIRYNLHQIMEVEKTNVSCLSMPQNKWVMLLMLAFSCEIFNRFITSWAHLQGGWNCNFSDSSAA